MINFKNTTDNELLWLIRGMVTAYESRGGLDSKYDISIKFVRLDDVIKVIFEYKAGETNNGEDDPQYYEVKYIETNEHFNLRYNATLLELNDKVMACLDNITETPYDYGY